MRNTRGALLLETLVALTVFAFAAAGTLSMLAQLSESERRAQAAERRLTDQDRLMSAYALLTRTDLDRRLGPRTVGPYLVEVQRPTTELYRVTIGDSAGTDLATLLYRPEATVR